MSVPREIHLNLFIHGVGKMDSVFFADGPVLMGNPAFRPVGRLEPTRLLGDSHSMTKSSDRVKIG